MFIKIVLVLSLLTATIVQVLADLIPFHGGSTSDIIHRLPILIMPAYFTFFIRFLMIGLFTYWVIHVIQQPHESQRTRRSMLFISAIIFDLVYIVLWHNNFYAYSTIALLSLLFIQYRLYVTYPRHENQWATRIPISVAIGWTFLMLIIDLNYALTLHNWSTFGLSDPLWAVIMLTISTAFALHFVYHYNDYAIGTVFVWTFFGIAVKNGLEQLFVSVAALFLSAVIITFVLWVHHQYKNKSIPSS